MRATADLRRAPAYTLGEAAHYLRLAESTLRSWLNAAQPLIAYDDPARQHLSFLNVVEAHVLAAIRRGHGVKLPNVRQALDYVGQHCGVERPLIEQEFQTDGVDLFIERYGDLINASRSGQQAMRELLAVYLKRIERDKHGVPIRLFPFTRPAGTPADPKLIVMNPLISFGRPSVTGTGIPASAIYDRYRAGDSVAELALSFQIPTDAVEEAIRCEAA